MQFYRNCYSNRPNDFSGSFHHNQYVFVNFGLVVTIGHALLRVARSKIPTFANTMCFYHMLNDQRFLCFVKKKLSTFLHNGNITKLRCVQIKKKRYIVTNACPYDLTFQLLCGAFLNLEEYSKCIDEGKTTFSND